MQFDANRRLRYADHNEQRDPFFTVSVIAGGVNMAIFARLIEDLQGSPAKRLAVANGADKDVLLAVKAAVHKRIATPVLTGDIGTIQDVARAIDFDLSPYPLIQADTHDAAAYAAVRAVRQGEADALMKGFLTTSTIMKAVLDRETGIRGDGLLSHLACFEIPALGRPVFVTDAAINIAPTLSQKVNILQNAVRFVRRLGFTDPIVGVLAAVEMINPAMVATTDAAELIELNRLGEIAGCRVGGPYALDNALVPELAEHKGLLDPLAGHVDILLAPAIETGNVLYKAMSFLTGGDGAGVVIGAKVPMVLASRSDNGETKLHSIALALAGQERDDAHAHSRN